MSVNKEILEQIEELAGLFVTPDRIARITQIDLEFLKTEMTIPGSEIYNAFYRGFDRAEIEYRESIIKLSKQGSPAAQEIIKKYISQLNISINE